MTTISAPSHPARDPSLREFCKRIPKIDLHAHLTGSISRQCLHDIWVRKKAENPELNLSDPLVAIPEGKVDYDLKTFFPLFSSYIYKLCNDVESVKQSTQSVLADFARDGVVYLELRTTPRAFPETGMTKSQYVDTVATQIRVWNNRARAMQAALILSVDRRNTPEEAMETVEMAVERKGAWAEVVGVDLCGDPMKGDMKLFAPAFRRAKEAGLKVTIHFGEAKATSSDEELRTLLSFGPDRIGHVIHVSPAIKEEIVKRRLALELCISCNVHAKMAFGSYPDHHFGEWWAKRDTNPVILCTDDVGVFCSPVSEEYWIAATHFRLGRRELRELSLGSVEAMFAGEGMKGWVKEKMERWLEGNLERESWGEEEPVMFR